MVFLLVTGINSLNGHKEKIGEMKGVDDMFALKNIDYVTDEKGRKKNVVLKVTDFKRIQEEIEDLEDALELEKARKNAAGFKKWKEFIKEVEGKKS